MEGILRNLAWGYTPVIGEALTKAQSYILKSTHLVMLVHRMETNSVLLCRPSYGGKFCEGSSKSYKLCNTEDCPHNTSDYRAQQCAEFNGKQFRGWYYSWRPYTRVDGETKMAQIKI